MQRDLKRRFSELVEHQLHRGDMLAEIGPRRVELADALGELDGALDRTRPGRVQAPTTPPTPPEQPRPRRLAAQEAIAMHRQTIQLNVHARDITRGPAPDLGLETAPSSIRDHCNDHGVKIAWRLRPCVTADEERDKDPADAAAFEANGDGYRLVGEAKRHAVRHLAPRRDRPSID